MKTLKYFLLLVVISLMSSGNPDVCSNAFYPMSTGNEFELQHFDTKDKLQSKIHYTITDGRNITGGYEADMRVDNYDKKDELTGTSNMTMKCVDNKFYIDMSIYMSGEQLSAYEGMDMTIAGDALEFPSSLSAGQTLPEGNLVITVSSGGMLMSTITIQILNRKVDAIESVTVPAGTFECFKISYDSKVTIGSVFSMTINSSGIEWLSYGNGMIRSESYNDNGKSYGYTVLSMLKK